jgi:uncharacterized membrane protein
MTATTFFCLMAAIYVAPTLNKTISLAIAVSCVIAAIFTGLVDR